MVIVDTSFLYAFFNKNDFHHKNALELYKKYIDEALLVPIEVVEELLTVITRKFSSTEAVKIGKLILDNDLDINIINSNELQFENAWKMFQKLSPHRFSFVDCLLLVLKKEDDDIIFTFDKILSSALEN